jgi:hypothetical protein
MVCRTVLAVPRTSFTSSGVIVETESFVIELATFCMDFNNSLASFARALRMRTSDRDCNKELVSASLPQVLKA